MAAYHSNYNSSYNSNYSNSGNSNSNGGSGYSGNGGSGYSGSGGYGNRGGYGSHSHGGGSYYGGRPNSRTSKIAVLIDADNVSSSIADGLFSELAGIGEVAVKRIYGDLTSPYLANWKPVISQYAIRPIQQFAFTAGKNASDSALIIDAMDLLHSGLFDIFCIVSSDSDFTGLAIRIKEAGLQVYGYGESKTPVAFRNACHRFTQVEVLPSRPRSFANSGYSIGSSSAASSSTSYAQKAAALPPPEERLEFPKDLICTAIENVCDEDGVALLSAVGLQLRRLKPDFDPRLSARLPLGSLTQSRSVLFEFSGSAGTLSVRLRPQDGDSADLDDDDTYDNGQDDDDDTRSDSQSQDTDDNSQA